MIISNGLSRVCVAGVMLGLSLAASARESVTQASAEIRRTGFGVPHIRANDERGLGYGIGQEHAQASGDGRGNAHAEQVFAKNGLADGYHPVTGNRLLEVAQVHEVRRDPVAVDQDLLADLRIARLVRDPQAVGTQRNRVLRWR